MNDRAEQAFRDAFAEHGAEPIQTVRPRRRFDGRWAVAAVVALVALAVPITLYQQSRGAGRAEPAATSQPALAVTELSGLATPKEGWKWVSHGDVAVQVPREWGFSDYLRPDWCVGGPEGPTMPEGPYVATSTLAAFSVGCPDVGPEFVRMHVDFAAPTDDTASTETLMRGVGSSGVWVVLEVDATADDRALAQEVLATAVTFERDASGCAPHAPFTSIEDRPDPWDIRTAEGVSAVGVCGYTDNSYAPETPNLDGSRPMNSAEGAALVAAIAKAPEGVSGTPEDCAAEYGERAGVVLRVADESGVHDVYLRIAGCHNLGWDDGVTRRKLTEACRPVFAHPPIRFDGESLEAYENCRP